MVLDGGGEESFPPRPFEEVRRDCSAWPYGKARAVPIHLRALAWFFA